MWTLIVVLLVMSPPYPTEYDGYTSKRWCEAAGAAMAEDLPIRFHCTKLPDRQ